jgi:hypothetical protein
MRLSGSKADLIDSGTDGIDRRMGERLPGGIEVAEIMLLYFEAVCRPFAGRFR